MVKTHTTADAHKLKLRATKWSTGIGGKAFNFVLISLLSSLFSFFFLFFLSLSLFFLEHSEPGLFNSPFFFLPLPRSPLMPWGALTTPSTGTILFLYFFLFISFSWCLCNVCIIINAGSLRQKKSFLFLNFCHMRRPSAGHNTIASLPFCFL